MPKKHYPVIREFRVGNNAGVPQLNAKIDVMKNLSQINHRLYRQSRMPECSITIDGSAADGTTIEVFALADSWWTMKALQMAKMAWDESNAEEDTMLKGRRARWNDFRVGDGLVATGGGGTGFDLLDAQQYDRDTLATVNFTAGEFDFSTVVDQAGVTKTFSWGAASGARYSIMDEYNASGNTDVDPTTPAAGPYSGLLPNLEAGAAAALQDQGNNPPYNATGYGDGYWVKVGVLHLQSGRQRLSTGFFKAPCGLIALTGAGAVSGEISVEVKKGDYKGIHAPSMLE